LTNFGKKIVNTGSDITISRFTDLSSLRGNESEGNDRTEVDCATIETKKKRGTGLPVPLFETDS
jgi:hypothetical protein